MYACTCAHDSTHVYAHPRPPKQDLNCQQSAAGAPTYASFVPCFSFSASAACMLKTCSSEV